jgi:hypothetical protein
MTIKWAGMFDGEMYLVKKSQDSKVCENGWQWARERFAAKLDLVKKNAQHCKVSGNDWRRIITLLDDRTYAPSEAKML